jgi:pimeloyl-ACP methyl ester carboxylesterase
MTTWKDTPTRKIDVNGVEFAYRELGTGSDIPVVFLHHLTAVLDDWDPRIIDGIAAHHRVIAFDNRGVGATGSSVPQTVEQMGADAIAFIRALGLKRVDLFGFSLGGGVAQMVALQAPDLVRRMILAGTGPRGGGGIDQITKIAATAYIKAALTLSDPRNFLFFPRTAEGKRAASDYLTRLKERTQNRDKRISMQARIAQLNAIRHAGQSPPDDLSVVTQPVLVANGDHDLMVDSSHSADMARRLPNAQLKIGTRRSVPAPPELRTRRPAIPRRGKRFRDQQENVMNADQNQHSDAITSYRHAPARTVTAAGVTYAYRELGPKGGIPVIFFVHLAGTLDNWDPRIIDPIAQQHHVIAFDNRGVGASTGTVPDTVEAMAGDAYTFINALGFDTVDIFSFSLGGMVAQALVIKHPELVRKLILTGTGPAGGEGIDKVAGTTYYDTLRATLTRQDPKEFLFFNRDDVGKRAARAFVERLEERTEDRDAPITVKAFRTQLKAIKRWGRSTPADLSVITQPTFIANGDNDRMVPTDLSEDMHRRIAGSKLVILPHSGHGAIFQYHYEFASTAIQFIDD